VKLRLVENVSCDFWPYIVTAHAQKQVGLLASGQHYDTVVGFSGAI